MPTIPSDFYPTVEPQGHLNEQNIQANPQEFGSQIAATLENVGDKLEQHSLQRQQLLNETTVNDLYANQFAPAFRDLYNKFYSLQGKDPETQFPAYQEQMGELRNQFRDQLANPMQQKMFDTMSRQRMNYELDGMARHAAQQTQVYHQETSNALLGSFVNDGIDKYNDPNTLQNRENSILVETGAYGQIAGQSPEEANKRAQHYIDQMYKGAISRAAVNNPQNALQMYDQYKAKLSGPMQAEVEHYLKPFQETIQAQRAYGVATGGPVASRITSEAAAQGVDPSTALTVWSCEGSVTNPATQNPRSQATGHFQFMPDAWADMGGTDQDRLDSNRQIELGVKLIAQNSKQLTQDLGRQPQPWEVYLAHQQGIGGATALMNADPNANAGQVVGNPDAITLNGGTKDTTAGQFLNMTKAYVEKKSQLFTADGVPTAQNLAGNYEAGLQAVTDLARQEHPGDMGAEEKYRSFYIQQMGQQLHAAAMTDRANRDAINSALVGPKGVQSRQDFMSNPNTAQAYADTYKQDPSIYDSVNKAITANAFSAWDPPATAETQKLYDDLNGMKTTDRDQFSKLDLMQYYGGMPVNQFNDLIKAQDKIRDKDAAEAAKHTNSVHALQVLQPLIAQAAADRNNQWYKMDAGSAFPDLKQYNQFVSAFEQNVATWRENNKGKLPSDADYRDIGQEMLFPQPVQQPTPALVTAQPKSPTSASAQRTGDTKPDPAIQDRVKQLSGRYSPQQLSGFLKAKNINPGVYGLPNE